MKKVITIICAVILVLSFLFCPMSILFITHSTIPTGIAVLMFAMNTLLFAGSTYIIWKHGKK